MKIDRILPNFFRFLQLSVNVRPISPSGRRHRSSKQCAHGFSEIEMRVKKHDFGHFVAAFSPQLATFLSSVALFPHLAAFLVQIVAFSPHFASFLNPSNESEREREKK